MQLVRHSKVRVELRQERTEHWPLRSRLIYEAKDGGIDFTYYGTPLPMPGESRAIPSTLAARAKTCLSFIRSGNGKFFGFGESEVPTMNEMKGRFAQLLSGRKSPTPLCAISPKPC